MKDYPLKDLPGFDSDFVEKGEMIQLPNGEFFRVDGKKHSSNGRGGEKVFLPEGARIFSNRLKLPAEVVEVLVGKSKKMTPAELAKQFDTSKFYKGVTSDDDLTRETSQLMFSKYSAMLNAIFQAQENMKNPTENQTSFKRGGTKHYANGGPDPDPGLGFQIPQYQLQGFPTQEDSPLSSAFTTTGVTIPYAQGDRFVTDVYNPLANHPFFTEGSFKKRGELEGQDRENLLSYQRILSNPQEELGLNDRLTRQFQVQLATQLRDAERANPDKFISKVVRIGDTEVPLASATDEQINNPEAEFVYTNERTGERGLVDGRNGNVFEDTTNQLFYPALETTYRIPQEIEKPLETLPTRGGVGAVTRELPKEVPTASVEEDVKPVEVVETGIDPEKLLSGLQDAQTLANLVSLRRNLPNYNFTPTETATTRFDPINRLQHERAFNLTKEALDNTNLPESVKQARLTQLQANQTEGISQIDLVNQQGQTANQNQNTLRVLDARNRNNVERTRANESYIQQLSRGRFIEQQQKQVYVDSLMENLRARLQNRMNIDLVNQLSRNFDFDPRTGVQYQEGQGVPQLYDQLAPFQAPAQ